MLGFLSPSGKFFGCEFHEHISLADKLLEEVYQQQSCNPVDRLCKYGWVVIQTFFIGFADRDSCHMPMLTRAQKDWLEANKDKLSHQQRQGLEVCEEINALLYEHFQE